jgi:hypothetical protein
LTFRAAPAEAKELADGDVPDFTRIARRSCVVRYAAVYKPDSEALDQFIKRKGGINACAVRFTRWLGRGCG